MTKHLSVLPHPIRDLYKVPFKELPHKEEAAREFDFISETGGKK